MSHSFMTYKILILTLLAVLLGVIFKDYTNSLDGDDNIYIIRILLVTLPITLLMFGFSELILDRIKPLGNNGLYYFICVIAGWGNYKIYDLMNITGDGLIDFLTAKFKKYSGNNAKIDELEDKINQIEEDKNK